MRGHYFSHEKRYHVQLIQAVNLFAFPPGLQPVSGPRQHWAISAIGNTDHKYRLGGSRGKWLQRPRMSIHLYAPGCVYQAIDPMHSGELVSAWLAFEADDHVDLRALCTKQHFAQFLDPQQQVIRLVNECADVCEQYKDLGFSAAQAVLFRIIHGLMQAKRNEEGVWVLGESLRRPKTNALVKTVHAYIEAHLHTVIRLESLAHECQVSVSTLSHRYREMTGESPLQTQANMRLLRAKQLLVMGERMRDVADRLGYADVYHFSKAFKKHQGLTPKAFLRQNQ